MNVLDGEAYQYAMPSNAFIASSDMQGGTYSNINMYTRVTKWSDSRMITALKLHSDKNLKYVFTIVSTGDHVHSNPRNSYEA